MFDMAVECGAAINIENRQGLTPLTTAAYLARMDMFFHIASIERVGAYSGLSTPTLAYLRLLLAYINLSTPTLVCICLLLA